MTDSSFTESLLKNSRSHANIRSFCVKAIELLENRKTAANSDYVFAGDGKSGYLIELRRQVQKQLAQRLGVSQAYVSQIETAYPCD